MEGTEVAEATSARIELLTAEVRTLMVGSRQVTLSVAKQLDEVPLEQLEPMGRVTLNDHRNLVIGRHRESGALALARYEIRRIMPWVTVDDLDSADSRRPIVCRKLVPNSCNEFRLGWQGRTVEVDASAVERCTADHTREQPECEHWIVNGCDATFAMAVARCDEIQARTDQAAALPLIVLAGLR